MVGRVNALCRHIASSYYSYSILPLKDGDKAWRVRVSEPDRSSKEVESDLVVSLTEKEVLISDALAAELCIVILNPRTGLWRFIDDDQSITRHSYRQQLWM